MTDVRIRRQGSLVVFEPETDAARDYLQDLVDPGATWIGGSLVTESRYASDIYWMLVHDGGYAVEGAYST